MKKILLTGILSTILFTANAQDKNGIIMTINGQDIPSSEFEYLYLKNSRQQLEPQTFDEYVDLFKIYRLKVAEAKALGKDTTESFRKEINQYKRELLQPYITDSTFIYSLVDVACDRDKEEVEVSHIMLLKTPNALKNKSNIALLDSLRKEIIAGASFTELAKEFSEDKSVVNNGGYLGYAPAGRFPYSFETAFFETPEGEVSEVVETNVGYHLVLPGKHRPSKGRVDVSHILTLVPKDAGEEIALQQKQLIDSIYNIVAVHPEYFESLATKYSDDKGSGKRGGKLPLFGAGEMVPEFEAVAFSLKDGEISAPFQTSYGWHIIKKYGSKPYKTYNEVKEEVVKRSSNPQDSRFFDIKNHEFAMLAKKHPEVKDNGDPKSYRDALLIAEEKWQYANNEDYRLLIDEYVDGSMLFEVSQEKVWDKASKDNEGLEKYFKKNKKKYKWTQPMAKGVLVQAKNKEVEEQIMAQCGAMSPDEAVAYIKNNFANDANAEKFVVSEGTVKMIDHKMFGGEPTIPKIKGYDCYFILDGRIITAPEEMNDVRGAVTSDYQEYLEKEWIKDLKKKYKITVYPAELTALKNKHNALK